MLHSSLIYQRQALSSKEIPITIHYYLLTTPSFSYTQPVYGIRILVSYDTPVFTESYEEEIPRISYSKSYTLHLLKLCFKHLVTPTDLYCSVDILMNQVS